MAVHTVDTGTSQGGLTDGSADGHWSFLVKEEVQEYD